MSHNSRNSLQKPKNATVFKQTRKVQFKPVTKNKKSLELAAKHLNDDDEDMAGVGTSSSFQKRRGSPRPMLRGINPNAHYQRRLIQSFYGWYHVTITALNKNEQAVNKDELWNLVVGHLDQPVVPMHYKLEKSTIIFYVNDYTAAEKLLQLGSKRLLMPDNSKVIIKVRTGYPHVTIDEAYKEKMKAVMAKRYNAELKSLDLSKFHEDPDFSTMFCGLFCGPILKEAIDIISQNIPDLEILIINDNKISRIDNTSISAKLPNLKSLNIGNNRIQNIAFISIEFKRCQLLELTLKGNPLVDKIRQRYRDEVAKRFPTVKMLDGEILVNNENNITTVPPAKASFFCQIEGTDIVRQFLEQYFLILDSSNRAPLADAYHTDALLSVTIPPANQAGRIESIWKHNRNFLRIIPDAESFKTKQLKVGRNSIVGFLCDFPKTAHNLPSFAVDMCLFTPKILSFNVSGLFKELDSDETKPVRYFHRQFIIVPNGSGFCIKNELLLVTTGHGPQLKEGAQLIV